MKKRIIIIAAIMMVSLLAGDISTVLALDTSDAQYIGSIREKNTSYTATNVCVPFTLNTDFLIDAGYIESDCSDTAITMTNGTTIPYMPAVDTGTDWIMFDNQISQNSAENFNLYIGGGTDMEGDIVYFPGTAGMTVVDSASLEPGNNFEIDINGFIDTTTNALILEKTNALEISTDSGDINVEVPVATQISQTVENNSILGTYADYRRGQTFTTTNAIQLDTISLKLVRVGATSYPFTVSLYATSAGKPTGAALVTDTMEGSDITTSAGGLVYSFDLPYSLSASTMYAIVTSYGGGSSSYKVTAKYYNDGSLYSGGAYTCSTDAGSTWTIDTGREMYFVVNGQYTLDLSTTIASGEYILKLSADGTYLKLYIDGTEKDSVALSGVSIINNSNDWVFCENNSVLYLRSADITISGTLKGSWVWENNTTFTDLSGNGNDATPTFRTLSSDADVEAEIITLESILPAEYETIDGDISPIITTTMTPPSELYNESGVRLPGADLINELLDAADIPHSLFWYPLLFGVAAFLGLLTYFFARDIMIQGIVNGSFLAFFGIMGGIPFWGVIPFALMVLAIIISRKTVSL